MLMCILLMSFVVVLVIGCGSKVASSPSANPAPIASTNGKAEKDAQLLEDARVSDEEIARLFKELKDAVNDDKNVVDAALRLKAVDIEFKKKAKAGDVHLAVAWRRQQLERKTIAQLAVDHREHPLPVTP
jgi:hypothetical protein